MQTGSSVPLNTTENQKNTLVEVYTIWVPSSKYAIYKYVFVAKLSDLQTHFMRFSITKRPWNPKNKSVVVSSLSIFWYMFERGWNVQRVKLTLFQNFYSIESYLLTPCLSERRHFLFAFKWDLENDVGFLTTFWINIWYMKCFKTFKSSCGKVVKTYWAPSWDN